MVYSKPTQNQFLAVRILMGSKDGKKMKTQTEIAETITKHSGLRFSQTDITNAETGKKSCKFLKKFYENLGYKFGMDGISVLQTIKSEKEIWLENEVDKLRKSNDAKDKKISDLKCKLGIPAKKISFLQIKQKTL